jgi:hypothetical protein
VNQYEQMGRNAWRRVQLGLKNLNDLRAKLGIQLQTMNTLFSGITLGSLGRLEEAQERMEAQFGRFDTTMTLVARLMLQAVSEERAGRKPRTVLSAYENSNGPEWDRLRMELVVAGVPNDELEDNSERIMELLDWAVNNGPDLEGLEEPRGYESVSVTGYMKGEPGQAGSFSGHSINEAEQPAQTYSYPTASNKPESPQVSLISSTLLSPMQAAFQTCSNTRDRVEIPVRILIVDDRLTRKFCITETLYRY